MPLRQTLAQTADSDQGREFDIENVLEHVGNCDLFISLVPWRSPSLIQLVKKLRPATSIGFFSNYDIEIPLDYSERWADLAFDIVRCFNPVLRLGDFTASPSYPNTALAIARSFHDMLPSGKRTLVVHADTMPEKMWGGGNFTKALDIFLGFHKNLVALLVGRSQQPLDSCFYDDRVIPFYDLSLSVSLSTHL